MSDAQEYAAKAFANDTKSHTVKILRDDGLYRHVRCEQLPKRAESLGTRRHRTSRRSSSDLDRLNRPRRAEGSAA